MECPSCGCPESAVRWSRDRQYVLRGTAVRRRFRRRQCAHCGARFTTREELVGPATVPLMAPGFGDCARNRRTGLPPAGGRAGD